MYYLPKPVCGVDLALMRRIDELHLEGPFAGSRMLRDLLHQESITVGRKHVRTLMRRMGIEALYRRPNTSRRNAQHPVYPYWLRGLKATAPTKSGPWTSRISRWPGASYSWPRWSTGIPGVC